ncbi:Cupredoxin [Cyathus striatus]|nr:Cupredoxin [Cyathus striatus]
MHFFAAAVVVSSLFALASAENFTVIVGKDGGLTYDPPQLTAKVGDTVAFRFVAKNHTVTQSSFAAPCTQLTTPALGVDSGYQPVAAGATEFPEWSITVDNATAPLWFYCVQGAHCKAGMVFALNPTAEKTYAAFLVCADFLSFRCQVFIHPQANAQGTGTAATGSTNSTAATGATGATGAAGAAVLPVPQVQLVPRPYRCNRHGYHFGFSKQR